MSSRGAALKVLVEVLRHGRSLTEVLSQTTEALPPRERALARAICFGVLRWLPRLDALLAQLVTRPLRRRDADVRALLLIGFYQLIYMRIPPHAAVSETVAASRHLAKPWASGLINGVLRSFQRNHSQLLARVDRTIDAAFAHPRWLCDRIRDAWPTDWRRVLEENNRQAPMTLRVNRLQADRESYRQQLLQVGALAHPTPHTDTGLTLERPVETSRLPGFHTGTVSVQDGASQLAADLLASQPGNHILDACAAPGGKTAHILERARPVRVLALERDQARVQQLTDTLRRLKLRAETRCADAARPDQWWDGKQFDRILLDAPCSASGVIRRHPDIKVHRRPEDLIGLVARQRALLQALWPLLAPGGLLLYATCSVLPEENGQQIQCVLDTHPDAVTRPIVAEWGQLLAHGRQILPGQAGMDGFYYALLEKRPCAVG
jgi:16S rRNA (cytosine967-C5)-methyltransferase